MVIGLVITFGMYWYLGARAFYWIGSVVIVVAFGIWDGVREKRN